MSPLDLVRPPECTPIADFVVKSSGERDVHLERAIHTAKTLASVDAKLGVLVTRYDYYRFSVVLAPDVPYGLIQERDLA